MKINKGGCTEGGLLLGVYNKGGQRENKTFYRGKYV